MMTRPFLKNFRGVCTGRKPDDISDYNTLIKTEVIRTTIFGYVRHKFAVEQILLDVATK